MQIGKTEFATFKNNRRDAQIVRFPQTNMSYFEACHFVTDGGLNDGRNLLPHVSIWNTNGVKFIGNTFENTTPITNNTEFSGTGIYIGKGDVIIERGDVSSPGGATTPDKPNRFENLFIGVEYSLVAGANTVTLNGNIFENNIYGITLDGVQYVEAVNNLFKVPALPSGFIQQLGGKTPPAAYQTFGIYGNSVSAFHYEQNTFETGLGNHSGNGISSYGVFVKNSDVFGQGGAVYHNTFTGLKKSNQFEEDNSNLAIDCNTYTSTYRDWTVASGNLKDQGTCPIFAGDASLAEANTFTPQCATNQSIFIGQNANEFVYSFYSDFPLYQSCNNLMVLNQLDCQVSAGNTVCPTNFNTGGISEIIGVIDGIKGEIVAVGNQVDDNDTDGLIGTISTASPGNVKNVLMGKSPYLSDAVLTTYSNSNPPNGHIKQVIIANSPVTATVKGAVDALNLPNGIRNQINAAQVGTSPRQELEQQIAYLENKLQLTENKLIRTYLKEDNLAAAIHYLEQTATPEAICALVPIKVEKRVFTEANNHLSYLRTVADGMELEKPVKAEELREFCKFYQFVIDLQTRTSKELTPALYEMSAGEENYIREIAKRTELPISANAQSVLRLIFDEQQPRYAVEVDELQNRLGGSMESRDVIEPVTKEMEVNEESIAFRIYPNPFKSEFTIETIDGYNGQVIIRDITGKIVLQEEISSDSHVLATGQLSNGLYFVELRIGDSLIGVQRIMKTQ
jgi:hypothetical protein